MSTPTQPERDSSGRFVKTPEPETSVSSGPDDIHPVSKVLFGWVEHKRTPAILLGGVIFIAVALTLIDVFLNRHDYFHFSEATGFYGLWGFGAFSLAVLSGWPLGKLLRRDEDYYGEADTTPQDVEDEQ